MPPPTALEVALTLVERPALVKRASRMPLPPEITFLLEVAAGESTALHSAQRMAMRSQGALRTAATFFIEQLLFIQNADSYRVLGCKRDAPRGQLRRHMALLVKWLHPDCHERACRETVIDRSVFVHRVTQAWEDLKNPERRAAYDRTLEQSSRSAENRRRLHDAPLRIGKEPQFYACTSAKKSPPRRLFMHRVERDTLFGRLLCYLRLQA